MSTQKIAITVPVNLLAPLDLISQQKKISRSKLITNILQEKIKEEQGKSLQDAYNLVFEDEAIQKEQLETTKWFEGGEIAEGQEW